MACILIEVIQQKRQYRFWYNFAVVGLNEEIIFSLLLKLVGLLINIFCIYINSSGIKKRDACSSYIIIQFLSILTSSYI